MDGDMFESTMDILYNLFDLVPVGGCIIIDDFEIREAKEAVATFLQHHRLKVEYIRIDQAASYFCKEKKRLLTWRGTRISTGGTRSRAFRSLRWLL